MLTIMQGDAYPLPLTFDDKDGNMLTPIELDDVEVVIDSVRFTASDGDIVFDSENDVWLLYFKQENTFKMKSGEHMMQVRLFFKNENVVGRSGIPVQVTYSKSKAVLGYE